MPANRFRPLLFATIAIGLASLPAAVGQQKSHSQSSKVGGPIIFQRATLTATNAQQYSFLGSSVAVNGNTVVVGAPGYDDGQGNYVNGAVYVYVKNGGSWQNMTQLAELLPSDGGNCSYCEFGGSVGISNDTIVASSDDGEVYVYVKPPNGWANMTETARLEGTPTNNCFCGGLAIDGDTIVVGSPLDQINAGALFVFVKPQSGWQTTSQANAKLTESVRGEEDQLGEFVAINGGTIISEGINGDNNQRAVFLFQEPNGGWSGTRTQTATLTSTDPLASPFDVSVSGNTVVAGIPDPYHEIPYADVWVKPQSGWKDMTQTAQLEDGLAIQDGFGWSVAVQNNLIIVGAPYASQKEGQFRGLGFVFVKPQKGWQNTSHYSAVLTNSDSTNDDAFGSAVAISGNTAVLGAPNGPNQADAGEAYIFQQ